MRITKTIIAIATAAALSAPVFAEDIEVQVTGTRISLDRASVAGLSNFNLRVVGPDGFHAETFSRSSAPSLRLSDFGELPDGQYSFEVTAATQEVRRRVGPRRSGEHGRSGLAADERVGVQQSGTFYVSGGRIVEIDEAASETE